MNNGEAIESGSKNKSPAGGLQIVLVDDSIPMREHVVASLSAIGGVAEIRQAIDVPSGLLLLDGRRLDLLILDIELPGQSGLDLLKIARRRNYTSVIIMFSMHDHPSLRQKCADLGADFFFHKLTEFERVADICRELAERQAQQAGAAPDTTHE
jgi:DNA-binding NarL/FixJ family response regulator